MSQHRNALADETSPYLLQHADNPVDWHPWNEAALKRARDENKPILLSVGYSACHWCHVMAHESFEDEDTAALMNEHFINIKVDREERPDLDRIYQLAQQMLTQRGGGWPLTMFLTHDDHLPFFGGTYFPRESRYGLPGFKEVLRRIAEFYRTEQDAIRRQNESLRAALTSMADVEQTATAVDLEPGPLATAVQQLEQSYDPVRGGFGPAPKFPHPGNIDCLLRHEARAPAETNAADMALNTLQKMAEGGIYDQLGGGFCRYSVDAEWTIPHFEKMLYDNGPLLKLCAEAWQFSHAPLFKRICEQTVAWVLREMRSPEGGFYSSLDADSEGEEGKYYVWTPDEIHTALADLLQAELTEQLFIKHYGLDLAPNFEGRWHLRVVLPVTELATVYGLDETETQILIDRGRQRLFEVREQRIRPGRDDKLLTSWNALMIKGLATAGKIFERDDWLDAAQQGLDCLHQRLWIDGRLRATYKDGRARFDAYLDDYAFLLDAILTLLETRWRRSDLDFAIDLANVLLKHFAAPDGGFYFTADDHEQLIQRSRSFMDESMPAGNGVAAFALQRLGHLLGETRYLRATERTLQAAWPSIQRLPFAHGAMLPALEEYCDPPQLVVIRGSDTALDEWRRTAQSTYQPARMVFAIPADESGLPGPLAGMSAGSNPTAYLCTGHSCSAPITDLQVLGNALSS